MLKYENAEIDIELRYQVTKIEKFILIEKLLKFILKKELLPSGSIRKLLMLTILL